jgi:crotonobetainyl-CoA:carnitine CoA-transferase CaiB-like acyl-CoA transferase
MNSIFKNLKVIELANVLAGPAAGMFFAELGATVIKIENKSTRGDVTRSWKLPSENPKADSSAYFASVNWNKKSLFLDLKTEADKAVVLDLIKDADIVISNYKKGDDVKLGMDYQSLKEINPSLIYAHLSGFGEDSSRIAFDLVLQAETGFMFMNGTSESGPIKMPVALIDILAAHQLKEGILIAMISKMKTGKGSKVSVSLYDSAVTSLANQATNWLMGKQDPQPMGSLHPNIAPYGELFSTSDDKLIVLAIGNDKQFEQLCLILKNESLLKNEKFHTNTARVKNRKELFEIIKPLIQQINCENIMNQFYKKDVPAGIIKSVKEVFVGENAKKLILKESNIKGEHTERVSSIAFNISAT